MSKNWSKWHYEYTDWCKYKCMECGRTMHEPTPHICNGMFRKHSNFCKEGDTIISAKKNMEALTIIFDIGHDDDNNTIEWVNVAENCQPLDDRTKKILLRAIEKWQWEETHKED